MAPLCVGGQPPPAVRPSEARLGPAPKAAPSLPTERPRHIIDPTPQTPSELKLQPPESPPHRLSPADPARDKLAPRAPLPVPSRPPETMADPTRPPPQSAISRS